MVARPTKVDKGHFVPLDKNTLEDWNQLTCQAALGRIYQHMGDNLRKGREIYNLGLQRLLLTVWFF